MERKKVIIFETSKTLLRAYELVLRGSHWLVVKVAQEERIFAAIEATAPDALIVERKALSDEAREALLSLPLPVVFCARERSAERAERLFLPRPFSSEELFDTLGAALVWEADAPMEDTVPEVEGFDTDEEPMILPEPDEEDMPFISEMTDEDDALPDIVEEPVVAEPELEIVPELAAQSDPVMETMIETEPEPESEPELVAPLAFDTGVTGEPSLVEQIAERVEERVVEEMLPAEEDLPEGAPMPDMIRAVIRRELREVMKEYFWEEAPHLMREILEEEIRKLAAKQ